MPRFNAESAGNVQPGRVMIVLKESCVPDDVIRDIVDEQGEVKSMHRPANNQQLCFIQYADPDTAARAIEELRSFPLFKAVDPALKSERYQENHPNDQNQKKQQDYLLECPQPLFFPLPLPHWDLMIFDRTYAFFSAVWNGVEIISFYAAGQAVTLLYPLTCHNPFDPLRPLPASTLTAVAATRSSSAAFSMKVDQSTDSTTPTKTDESTSLTSNKQFNQNRNDGRNNYNNNNNFRRNDGGFNNRNGEMDSPPRQAPMETQQEVPLGCWYCAKMPNFECQCGAFYCDTGCQRADWPKHKDNCMPRMVPISFSNKMILQQAVASRNASTISSTPYAPSSPEYGGNNNNNNQQQQQRQQPQQNRFNGNDYNQQQQQYGQRNNQQQNVQNRLANGPRQNSQQNGSDQQVSEAATKLQRMKLNKAGSSSSPGRKQILEPGRFPPEGARVKITTSLQSGCLYIYHNNGGQHGGQSDFQALINRLHQAADNESRPLAGAPKVDDVVFAPYQGMFYRAKVLAVKETKIDVQFPDFGNLETVALKECREILNEELKWAKYLSFPVMLDGVEGPLTKEQKQMVEQLEFEEEFELVAAETVPDSEVRQVVLKRERQNVTLNMALVELKEKEARQRRLREEQRAAKERLEKAEKEKQEVAAKIPDPDTYKPLIFDEVATAKQLTADKRYTLCIIDASEVLESKLISVIAAEHAPQYGEVVADCERFGLADPNEYQPKMQGELCLGRYKADWSRVLYDDEENSLLLDVGTLVTPDEFRRFPAGLSFTVYNNEVFVENMPLLEQMMKDGKPESIHGNTVDAWVAVSDNGSLGIRIIPKAN